MKHRIISLFSTVALLMIVFTTTTSSSSGGSGSSSSCGGGGCHTSGTGTTITVSGIPSGWTPNQVYACTVTVSNPSYTASTSKAGFKITVNGGTMSNPSAGTSLSGSNLSHNTPLAMSGGSASWTFSWTAPSSASTLVTVNAAGNAVNGNNASSGDVWNTARTCSIHLFPECIFVYSISYRISPPTKILQILYIYCVSYFFM